VLLPKIKKIPKNTNGRLAIPALAGLLVVNTILHMAVRRGLVTVQARLLHESGVAYVAHARLVAVS